MEDIENLKDIFGFEDRYKISNKGNLYSKYKNKILVPSEDKDGYKYITLYNGKGFHKFFRMSRMVAINFIPNPKNLSQVNHKNHIKEDNRVDNLEWCEDYENQRKRSEYRGGLTSKYVGVRFHSNPNNWQARIGTKRKTYTLGLYKTELEASEAYIKAYNNYYNNNILPK